VAPLADPYRVLGLRASASDTEVQAAFRRLARRHHPDLNRGSIDAARRFELVHQAYEEIRRARSAAGAPAAGAPASSAPAAGASVAGAPAAAEATSTGPGAADADARLDLDARLAALEREVRKAAARRDAAARDGAGGRAGSTPGRLGCGRSHPAEARRPSDEELGYYHTDDSLLRILDDAAELLAKRLAGQDEPAGADEIA